MTDLRPVRGVLFDKDGTLIDFRQTWDGWAGALIDDLTADEAGARRLARAMVYDLDARAFDAASPIIAGTAEEALACIAAGLPGTDPSDLEAKVAESTARAAMAPVVPLGPLCARLRGAGLTLGVATNDAESVARSNLQTLGIEDQFPFIAGYDSGYGGKPEPGMVAAFCDTMGLAPEICIMVGDSTHDLIAAARAGVRGVGVLTGTASADDLAPHAEVVLPDIGHLPGWLGL